MHARGFVIFGHVGNDSFTRLFIVLNRQRKGGLGGWFVHTREGLPGKGGFKLGPDQLLFLPVDLVIRRINPHHRVGQTRIVIDHHGHRPRRR